MAKKVRKAVFPAAGLGTRFLPATKAQPKEMLPLVDKPIIQYAVEEALESGIENIIIVTGRGKNAIEDHFDVSFAHVTDVDQIRDAPHLLEQVELAVSLQIFFELKGDIKMIFDGVLAAARNDDDVLDAGL